MPTKSVTEMQQSLTEVQQQLIMQQLTEQVRFWERDYRSFDFGDGEFIIPLFQLYDAAFDLFVDSDVEEIISQLMELLNARFFGYSHQTTFSTHTKVNEDETVTMNTGRGADTILYMKELFAFLIKAHTCYREIRLKTYVEIEQ